MKGRSSLTYFPFASPSPRPLNLRTRRCLKDVAEKEGGSVTFMAKPFTEDTGSGCHIHINLTKRVDAVEATSSAKPAVYTNAFAGDIPIAPSHEVTSSQTFRYDSLSHAFIPNPSLASSAFVSPNDPVLLSIPVRHPNPPSATLPLQALHGRRAQVHAGHHASLCAHHQ